MQLLIRIAAPLALLACVHTSLSASAALAQPGAPPQRGGFAPGVDRDAFCVALLHTILARLNAPGASLAPVQREQVRVLRESIILFIGRLNAAHAPGAIRPLFATVRRARVAGPQVDAAARSCVAEARERVRATSREGARGLSGEGQSIMDIGT